MKVLFPIIAVSIFTSAKSQENNLFDLQIQAKKNIIEHNKQAGQEVVKNLWTSLRRINYSTGHNQSSNWESLPTLGRIPNINIEHPTLGFIPNVKVKEPAWEPGSNCGTLRPQKKNRIIKSIM